MINAHTFVFAMYYASEWLTERHGETVNASLSRFLWDQSANARAVREGGRVLSRTSSQWQSDHWQISCQFADRYQSVHRLICSLGEIYRNRLFLSRGSLSKDVQAQLLSSAFPVYQRCTGLSILWTRNHSEYHWFRRENSSTGDQADQSWWIFRFSRSTRSKSLTFTSLFIARLWLPTV